MDAEVKKFKPITHFTPFNMSARIPDRTFCEILDMALTGYIETKDIRSECLGYRKQMLMEDHAFDIVCTTQSAADTPLHNFDDVKRRYPPSGVG